MLNNRGGVKPEVEERVRLVATSMGYKPNAAAKAFSTLLLPSVGDLFFMDLINGIKEDQKELEDYRVKVILKETSGYDVDRQLYSDIYSRCFSHNLLYFFFLVFYNRNYNKEEGCDNIECF